MQNQRIVHIRALNLNAVAGATVQVFKPFPGKRLIITQAYADIRKVTGSSVAPHILVDNGTDAQNIVADVALGTTANRVQPLAVVNPTRVVDVDNPLRIKFPTHATATKYVVDVEFVGIYK